MLEERNRKKKALIEDMSEEAAKRARIHESTVSDRQKKDQVITAYRSKTGRCNRAFEIMLKVGTSPDVVIEVIRDLIANIIS